MHIFAHLNLNREELYLKAGQFIIFVSIVLTIYGLVNTYIFIRGLQALPAGSQIKTWYSVVFWVVASAFVLARVLGRAYPCLFSGIVTWIGSFWLAFMLYLFLIVVLVDFTRILNHFFHIYPSSFYIDYPKTKLIALWISFITVSLVVLAGFINARTARVKELDITIQKSVPGEKSLRLVMVSDVHMGNLIAQRKTTRLVNKINELRPDLVVFAGDLVDEDLEPVIKNNLGQSLTAIKSKLGVYAIPGNHEYIGGAEPAIRYLMAHGITMLRDTAVMPDGRFYLVGRDDRDKSRFTGKKRKDLKELFSGIEMTRPIILLDHQPFNLQKVVELGVDLQLSGHTHHGQMWPFNLITNAIYDVSWGYLKIGQTQFYVSSGYGTWGPPVRLGNRPEIVLLNITFKQ
jgi:predicted MPP superfamily phosphohydrolase